MYVCMHHVQRDATTPGYLFGAGIFIHVVFFFFCGGACGGMCYTATRQNDCENKPFRSRPCRPVRGRPLKPRSWC